nr:hypothetical protein RVX_1990 [Nitratidesulfovibrio sp. HK-II]
MTPPEPRFRRSLPFCIGRPACRPLLRARGAAAAGGWVGRKERARRARQVTGPYPHAPRARRSGPSRVTPTQ